MYGTWAIMVNGRYPSGFKSANTNWQEWSCYLWQVEQILVKINNEIKLFQRSLFFSIFLFNDLQRWITSSIADEGLSRMIVVHIKYQLACRDQNHNCYKCGLTCQMCLPCFEFYAEQRKKTGTESSLCFLENNSRHFSKGSSDEVIVRCCGTKKGVHRRKHKVLNYGAYLLLH